MSGLISRAKKTRWKINACKKVLHLNRGMCKLKMKRYHDALWDCDKALEIEPENVKGLYRRCLVYTAKLGVELQKETDGEFWVVDKAWKLHDSAKADIDKAIDVQKKESGTVDKFIIKAQAALQKSRVKLKAYTANYKEQQKTLYRDRIMAPLEEENRRLAEKERLAATEAVYDDMPEPTRKTD